MKKKSKPKVLVILGPTATGKSDLAVKLAKKIRGEIISADSRQVYKYLNIGTGKISKKEMKGVPHHLLDVVSPKNLARLGGKFTVVEYQNLTFSAIAEIVNKGKIPIICGGTGFYIDAITKGIIFPEVPPNPGLRKQLIQKSTAVLFCELEKLDKERAKNIDPKNKVRLIRAIEIARAVGKVPNLEEEPPSYKFIKIGLRLPSHILKSKIEKRVGGMFKQGLLKEIEKLKKLGVSKKRLKEFGFEYNEPTPEKVITGTIKYASRQMTWFKRDKEIKWFTLSRVEGFSQKEYREIASFVRKKFKIS